LVVILLIYEFVYTANYGLVL